MRLDQTDTPLVLVRPDDRAETVLERAMEPGSAKVQLLVPEGVTALQRPEEAERLRRLAEAAGISLVLISSDPATLEAARVAKIATVTVHGAQVQAPPHQEPAPAQPPADPRRQAQPDTPDDDAHRQEAAPAPPPDDPYRTRSLDEAPTPAAGTPTSPDEAFLESLDDLDAGLAARPTASVDEEVSAADASLAAALSEPQARPARTMTDEDLLAATLAAEPGMTPPRVARPAPAPRQRPLPPPVPAQQRAPAPAADRIWRGRPEPVGTRVTAPARPAQRRSPILWLALAALALLLAIAGALLWSSRVTVVVTPPVRPDTVEPITALPVPLAPPGSDTGTAVEAESIRSDVAFSNQGEVTQGTLTPSGSASGTLTIFNSTQQAILLPTGTEFTAVKADGQEVPFVSTADVQVPGATTSDTGAQVITSRGQASIPVTARSPGSTSNVEGNTIRRVTPLGGVPFNLGTGGFLVQHGPLAGGSEEEVRIVKDNDVSALLAPALEGLDAEARRQLEGLARAKALSLDPTTILPRRADLEQLQGFEYIVQPAVGEILDPANPRFTLTVQSSYSGLGVPADKPLNQQLGPVLTEQLLQAGRIVAGDCRAPAVTNWRWDGESLLVDGQIAPDTISKGCTGGLDAATLDQVRDAVRGKSREEAQAALDALVAQGLIGGYTLPEVQQLPEWDWQLQVQG